MLVAITRDVSPSIEQCELTHVARAPIDVDVARAQHRAYERCLVDMGCEIHHLPVEPDLPDSVFVEDAAIVLDELAVITHPGAESRRPETLSVARALEAYRSLRHIEPPGTLDGGDVLRVGRTLYVGLSRRTNEAGIAQLRQHVKPYAYAVKTVPIEKCLHLKSGVTQVGERMLLINRKWVGAGAFKRMELVDVAPSEPTAANALLIGDTVVYPESHFATRKRLEERGIDVSAVDISELAKAEGGVTCCSLIFQA